MTSLDHPALAFAEDAIDQLSGKRLLNLQRLALECRAPDYLIDVGSRLFRRVGQGCAEHVLVRIHRAGFTGHAAMDYVREVIARSDAAFTAELDRHGGAHGSC